MSFLEGLFGRSSKERTADKSATPINDGFDYGTLNDRSEEKAAPMEIFHPTSFNDVERIIDALKRGKNTIVHLENLKPATLIRVMDMLAGAVYALGGGLYEIQKKTYMFSPSGLTIK